MDTASARSFENRTFDVVVIGGGIVGAGVARDAALRGLEVALLEKNDFASGTTSGSTRLIHGGLRYLEMLDFRLVRMDLREREILLAIAPHLVRPMEFLLPFFSRSLAYRLKMRLGMVLYDALGFDKSLPRYRFLSREEVCAREPDLRTDRLQGAMSYYDAQVISPERLCLENLLDARDQGACLANYAEVTGVTRPRQVGIGRSAGAVSGVRVLDALDGGEFEVRGRVVVNATGPWLDQVARNLTPEWTRRIRTSKGVHIACPPASNGAVVLFSKIDGRLFFVIPWLGHSLVGTTDTDYLEDPGSVRVLGEDVRYLLDSAAEYFPALASGDIRFTNAGVRALVRKRGSESSVSRLHRVVDGDRSGAPGLLSILGGKITGYRAIAEEVTDQVCRKLKCRRPCVTATTPLPGARDRSGATSSPSSLPPRVFFHLQDLYGSRGQDVTVLAAADKRLREPLAPEYPDIAAQVVFAVREEECRRALDFILRRTLLGFSTDQGRAAFPAVIARMADELHWSAARREREAQACDDWIRSTWGKVGTDTEIARQVLE